MLIRAYAWTCHALELYGIDAAKECSLRSDLVV